MYKVILLNCGVQQRKTALALLQGYRDVAGSWGGGGVWLYYVTASVVFFFPTHMNIDSHYPYSLLPSVGIIKLCAISVSDSDVLLLNISVNVSVKPFLKSYFSPKYRFSLSLVLFNLPSTHCLLHTALYSSWNVTFCFSFLCLFMHASVFVWLP